MKLLILPAAFIFGAILFTLAIDWWDTFRDQKSYWQCLLYDLSVILLSVVWIGSLAWGALAAVQFFITYHHAP